MWQTLQVIDFFIIFSQSFPVRFIFYVASYTASAVLENELWREQLLLHISFSVLSPTRGRIVNVVDLALQADWGRTIRPYTQQKDVQWRFSLGDFPRLLTQHKALPHHKNSRPFQLDSCCLSIKAVSLQESQGQDTPESRQCESVTALLKSNGTTVMMTKYIRKAA